MSNVSDFFCPDETPVERDPDNEEMMPIEERMLERLAFLRSSACAIIRDEEPEFKLALAQLEDYFKQAITDRDHPSPWDCDYDTEHEFTDPFAEETN